MRPSNELLVNAVSAGASFNGTIFIPTRSVVAFSVQVIVSSSAGSPNGVLKLQFSNDQPLTGDPTNWMDITNATATFTDDGAYGILKMDSSYEWIRAVYTRTSGTGTITARMKSIGF